MMRVRMQLGVNMNKLNDKAEDKSKNSINVNSEYMVVTMILLCGCREQNNKGRL